MVNKHILSVVWLDVAIDKIFGFIVMNDSHFLQSAIIYCKRVSVMHK